MDTQKSLVRIIVLLLVAILLTASTLTSLAQARKTQDDLIIHAIQSPKALNNKPAQWFRVISNDQSQNIRDIIETEENEIVFIGQNVTGPYDNQLSNSWIAKHTVTGNLIWQKHIGGATGGSLRAVKETNDGNLIMVGSLNNNGWIMKLNMSGNVIWQQDYSRGNFLDINSTSDGGFIVTGLTTETGGPSDLIVLKTNHLGAIEWQRTLGKSLSDFGQSVLQTHDNGYAIVGSLESRAAWIIKLNSNGTLAWQKSFENGSSAVSIIETSDNDLVIAGSMRSSAWLSKIDGDGNVLWQNIYTGLGNSHFDSMSQTEDGGFIAAGSFYYPQDEPDALVMKVTGDGTIQWQNKYDTGKEDGFRSIEQTNDGGYLAAGYTVNIDETDALFLKLDQTGTMTRCAGISQTQGTVQPIDSPIINTTSTIALLPLISRTTPITISNTILPFREICPLPPVSIAKQGPAYAIGGCPFTYTLTITNNMSSDVTGIVVTDSIPMNAEYVGGGTFMTDVVSWTLPNLAPGEIATNLFAVKATTSIINTDYRVFTNEGYSTTGQIPVVTTITNLNFLPLTMKNYCGSFFDAFSNSSSGWYVGDDAYVRSEYLNGEFRILTKQPGYVFVYSAPSCAREYYASAVDVRWTENRGAEYGLLMGINANFDEYYLFLVSADFQDYGLLKRVPGGWQTIVDFTPSTSIHTGGNSNKLEAIYLDGNMILMVNGTTLGTWFVGYANAPTWTGIFVHPYNNVATADARFDNFSVETQRSTLHVKKISSPIENEAQVIDLKQSLISDGWPER